MKYTQLIDCDNCIHRGFCKYSERYLEATKRLKDFVEMPSSHYDDLFQVAIRCTGHPQASKEYWKLQKE